MSLVYHPFRPIRPAEQYIGQAGSEIGGQALSPMALQLIAEAKVKGRRPSGVWVDGEYVSVQTGQRTLSIRLNPHPDSGIEPHADWRGVMP